MKRRGLLQLLSFLLVGSGGCVGDEPGDRFTANGGTTDEPEEETPETTGAMEILRDGFEERGLSVLEMTQEGETIVLVIQTSGDIDEDMRIAAGAYATEVGRVDEDLRVRVEDRGLRRGVFEIENTWARGFVDGRILDDEYLERINETLV